MIKLSLVVFATIVVVVFAISNSHLFCFNGFGTKAGALVQLLG